MKKPAQPRKKKSGRSREEAHLSDSPIYRGLLTLIPAIIAIYILGLQLVGQGEREIFLRLGRGEDSPTLYYQAARKAVEEGDLVTGRWLYQQADENQGETRVLGISSELPERLWPELRWEREWKTIERRVEEERSAGVLLRGVRILRELGREEAAEKLLEKAGEIDPNNDEVRRR